MPRKSIPNDPFGRVPAKLPRALSREGRVELLAEVAECLIAGTKPDAAAATWVGSSILSWLLAGERSNLARDHLEIAAPPRSKSTPQRLYKTICAQKTYEREELDIGAPSTDHDPAP